MTIDFRGAGKSNGRESLKKLMDRQYSYSGLYSILRRRRGGGYGRQDKATGKGDSSPDG